MTRTLALTLTAASALPLLAQEAMSVQTDNVQPLVQVDNMLIYALVLMAVVQVIFILSMASIMRTMSGPGAWAKWLAG